MSKRLCPLPVLLLALSLLLGACGGAPAAQAPMATAAPAGGDAFVSEPAAPTAAAASAGAPALAATSAPASADAGRETAPEAAVPAPATGTGGAEPASGEATGSAAPGPERPLGQEASLRAGEIDDNAALADYLLYLQGYGGGGVRVADIDERYIISVLDDNQRPVLDARVTVYDGERPVFNGRTYAGGRTIFMPRLFDVANADQFRVVAEYGQASAETIFQRGEQANLELGLRGVAQDPTLRLDLLFLLDTTGSMGDELSKVQATIDSIAQRIDGFTPRPSIRYGLVAYKDIGDEYVTRQGDFTSDLTAFREQLGQLSADGGGDTPEALDEALYDAVVRASWSEQPAVRLVFLVADAAPHVDRETQFTYLDGTREAVARGIKLYPIAASNTDEPAEYVFRQLAQQTMAGFVFLTYQPGASSGAPGESTSLEAGEQPYTVERLDDLIVSIVERELAAAIGAR